MTAQSAHPDSVLYDRLIVIHHNRPVHELPLNKDPITVGRGDESDIVLDYRSISRQHIRIETDDEGNYLLTDLHTTNGTWLNNQQLEAGVSVLWRTGDLVRIGDLWLRIETDIQPGESQDTAAFAPDENGEPDPAARARDAAFLPPQRQFGFHPAFDAAPEAEHAAADESRQAVDALLIPTAIALNPGSVGSIMLEIINRSDQDDDFTVISPDLPRNWLTLPEHSIRVAAHESQMVSLPVHPPRLSSSYVGTHTLQLQVTSINYPARTTGVRGQIRLEAFHDFALSLYPRRIPNNGAITATLHNLGNTTATFKLKPVALQEVMTFQLTAPEVVVPAGQQEDVPLRVRANRQAWIGEDRALPFELIVTDDALNTHRQQAVVVVPSAIPGWLIAVMGVCLMALCTLIALLSAVQFGQMLTRPDPVVLTQTQQAINTATQDAILSVTATYNASDPDEDGLTNEEEAAFETDPDNRDTDGDGLTDGDEINFERTDPTLPDTDGDGFPDAADDDPLVAFNPVEPADFIEQYYDLVGTRAYDTSYPLLTETYITTNNLTRESYEAWWDSVADITLNGLTLQRENDTVGSVCYYVDLSYTLTDGTGVWDNHPYLTLLRDPASGSWRIYAKAGLYTGCVDVDT